MSKMTQFLGKIYQKLPVLIFDTCAIPVAWYFAYWLRYNMQPFPNSFKPSYAFLALGIMSVVQLSCYYYFKVYRGLWRFSSLSDVERIIRAVVCASVFVIPVFYLSSLLTYIPRSVLPLYSLNLVTLLCNKIRSSSFSC